MGIDCTDMGETQIGSVPLNSLFAAFFRVGLTAFGGPAMIPHIRALVVEQRKWISEQDFRLGISICQVIPGATVMQLAAFVGLRLRGLIGALTAFVAFALPAFMLITLLSALYFTYADMSWIRSVFAGLQVVVVAIIASAAFDFIRKYTSTVPDMIIGAGAAAGILLHIHPVLIIAAAILVGMVVYRGKQWPESAVTSCPKTSGISSLGILLGGIGFIFIGLWVFFPELAGLMLRMMRVDMVAFGGGFAALPMMLHEVVHSAGWMSEKVFMDGIALGQVTPGPIVITSAFVGYAVMGMLGAAVAAMGIFSPSILILVWAVPHCDRLLGSRIFQRSLHASLATLGGLMAATAFSLALPVDWNIAAAGLGAVAFIALRRKVNILWVVLAGIGCSAFL